MKLKELTNESLIDCIYSLGIKSTFSSTKAKSCDKKAERYKNELLRRLVQRGIE